MLVSYHWLKEYVDIDLSPQDLAELITRSGVEIGGIEAVGEDVNGVVVAEVVSCEDHPDSDHLHLCQVTTDGENRIQVVCGAPNVASGQRVAFAKVGAVLPGDFKIGAAKLRGVESNGMICSMQELGVPDDLTHPDDKDGIRILPADAPLGTDAMDYLGLRDFVYDLDLTPNRSDCLSVYNVAREVGALLQKSVRPLETSVHPVGAPTEDAISVDIEDPDLCHRYVGTMIRDCVDGRSPLWMEQRLQSAGMRPKSLLVDITNYVMLETGQPLHAFNYDTIAEQKIRVRRAEDGQVITTLDEEERRLTDAMLLICDGQKAVGIAGIMGGANSDIEAGTTEVFLESAYFEPRNIRRSALALGLRTEASIRNEKGIDPEMTVEAAARAAHLLETYAQGKVAPAPLDVYPTIHEPVKVRMSFVKVNAHLGTEIAPAVMIDYLQRLKFDILTQDNEGLTVQVPSWRPDVTIEEDLIEEIARLYGYDEIPATLPYGATHPGVLTAKQRLRRHIKDRLSMQGLHEVVNYSFTRQGVFDALRLSEDSTLRDTIPLQNPLSEELAVMRTELISGLLDVVKNNRRQGVNDITVFEHGRIFLGGPELSADTLADEQEVLAVAMAGAPATHWMHSQQPHDYFELKGILEDLGASLRLPPFRFERLEDHPTWHPGRSAAIWLGEEFLGVIGEIHPEVLKNWGIKDRVIALEVYLRAIYDQGLPMIEAQSPAKYPSISRDIALVVKDKTLHRDLEDAMRGAASELLVDLHLFDVYTGEQVAEDEKSLAYALRFQSLKETLTDEVVDADMQRILVALENVGAKLRA